MFPAPHVFLPSEHRPQRQMVLALPWPLVPMRPPHHCVAGDIDHCLWPPWRAWALRTTAEMHLAQVAAGSRPTFLVAEVGRRQSGGEIFQNMHPSYPPATTRCEADLKFPGSARETCSVSDGIAVDTCRNHHVTVSNLGKLEYFTKLRP